jgi:hypothetical protein
MLVRYFDPTVYATSGLSEHTQPMTWSLISSSVGSATLNLGSASSVTCQWGCQSSAIHHDMASVRSKTRLFIVAPLFGSSIESATLESQFFIFSHLSMGWVLKFRPARDADPGPALFIMTWPAILVLMSNRLKLSAL